MAVYFANTEITGIKDLFPLSSKDITGLYFGDTELFTVRDTYDGTLPATYSANGSMLVDYQIYGSAGGVGEEVDITGLSEPLCGIGAYTDSLDLSTGALARRIKKFIVTGEENWVVRTGQPSKVYFIEFYSTNFIRNKALCTHYINQESGSFDQIEDKHCLVALSSDGIRSFIGIRDSSYNSTAAFVSYLKAQYAAGTPVILWCVLANEEPATITVPSGLTGTLEGYLIQDGTPTPQTPIYPTANGVKQADDTYSIKYGYKLDMSVSDGTTEVTTPIYIGSDPLGEDEYVDYGEGKVYRRTDNLFSPDAVLGEYWLNDNKNYFTYNKDATCWFIPIEHGETYTVSIKNSVAVGGFVFRVAFCDTIPSGRGEAVGRTYNVVRLNRTENNITTVTVTNSSNHAYIAIQPTIYNIVWKMLTLGPTAHEQYIPYLQPTDPPVPLPALPTVDGTNIVDYAGQSVAVPSRFVAKYRKEGFN